TGGGMGPGTITALQVLLTQLRGLQGALVSATDANAAGDRFAARQAELAREAQVAFERLRPPEGLDWNDVLRGLTAS
ncbi:MAG: toprim domain-containing protein, partial [Acetobacteraceae bacterium]|nr:toprim domain-containing protein [Acetobacteraceae bacterium]